MAIGASIGFPEHTPDSRIWHHMTTGFPHVIRVKRRVCVDGYGTTQGASHTFCDRVIKFGFACIDNACLFQNNTVRGLIDLSNFNNKHKTPNVISRSENR